MSVRLTIALLPVLLAGCSIEKFAINKLGNALSGIGSSFASDEDPELVGAALPFSLKLMEGILEQSPDNRDLLLSASSGFTQYAYAFVQPEADELEAIDYERSLEQVERVQKLYLRAREYGLRGLEVRHAGFTAELYDDPATAVEQTDGKDVAFLYWTAAAWGSAVAVSTDEPALVGELHIVEALIDRVVELDETFDDGAVYSFLISYEPNRPGDPAEGTRRAREAFERAVEMSNGKSAGPYVSLAEAVALPAGDAEEFQELLEQALAIDPDAAPEIRLANLIAQRRARWLLDRLEDLFLLPLDD